MSDVKSAMEIAAKIDRLYWEWHHKDVLDSMSRIDLIAQIATIIEERDAGYRQAVGALVGAVKYHLIHLKNVGLNLRDMLGDDEMKRFMHKPGMGEVMITSTKLSTALAAVEKAKEA